MNPPRMLLFRRLHRWFGLVGALAFVLMALTGAALVFRAQVEPAVSAGLLVVPPCQTPLPLDRLVGEAARAAPPDAGALRFVRLAGDPTRSARVRFSDGRWIHVDRCSARVLGAQQIYTGPVGTISWLHIFGFMPYSETVLKMVGIAFAALITAGVLLWRPRASATVRSRRAVQWHRTLGCCAAPILLTIVLTGILQAFSWGAARPAAPPMSHAPPASVRPALAQMLDQVETLTPQASKIQIRFPAGPSEPITFEVVGRGATHANAIDYLMFDPNTGAMLKHVPYASNTPTHRLYLLAAGIHYGWVGGLPAQLLLLTGALSAVFLAWTGTASYLRMRSQERLARKQRTRLPLRVARKTVEADGICSFELVGPRGQRLPRFTAGAHIDVHLGPDLVRQYSLCNPPHERHRYLICVLHVQDSRGGSRALHSKFKSGDLLEVGLPRNHFPLCRSARRSLLFAGGIGITPILCMAEELASKGADFDLHYFARSRERAAFVERLLTSRFSQRVHFHFSEGTGTGTGSGAQSLSMLLATPETGTHVYTCGPTSFMDAVMDTARHAGWSAAHLHREVFAGAAPSGTEAPFELRLARSGRRIQVGRGESALDALLAAGLRVPHACRQGLCGACLTRVVDGEPEHRDLCLSPIERARNDVFTPCCSRARGEYLALDL